jgi:phospholipid/cholesterol/gamma-HCH transport system substrate-binding protein
VQLADDGSNSALRDPSDSAQARIELRPSFFERVSDSGEQLVVRVAAVAQQLEKWLADDNRRAVTEALTALQAASKKVGALSEAATPGVQSVPDLTRQAAQTLRNADTAITDLRALVAQLGKRLDAIERIAASAERVGAAVQQVSAAGTSLSITASRDTMPKLNQLLDEIARSTRGLERLVEDLSANPSSIVFGRAPLPPGPGEPGFVHGAPR